MAAMTDTSAAKTATEERPSGAGKRRGLDLRRYRDLSLIPVILVLGLIGFIVSPAFLTTDNLVGVAQQSTELSLLVLAEAMILIAGRMDLSLESTIGVAPVIAVWLVLPANGGRFHGLGLHTALDTSGFLGARADARLLAATDLVLLDIKSWDRALYRRLTGAELHPTLMFARRLADLGKPVHVRFVLVPGLTDAAENVDGVARFAASLGNVERVDVLPFHKLATGKYQTLGIRFPLADKPTPTEQQTSEAKARFADAGLAVY